MGAALRPHIADEGWAGFRGAEERGGRGESAKVVADESQEEGGGGGEGAFATPHICYSFVPSREENSRKRSGDGER